MNKTATQETDGNRARRRKSIGNDHPRGIEDRTNVAQEAFGRKMRRKAITWDDRGTQNDVETTEGTTVQTNGGNNAQRRGRIVENRPSTKTTFF